MPGGSYITLPEAQAALTGAPQTAPVPLQEGSRHKAPSRSGPMGAGGQRSPCVTASRDPNPAPSARRVSRTARGGIRGVRISASSDEGAGKHEWAQSVAASLAIERPRETRGRQGAMADAPGGGPGPSGAGDVRSGGCAHDEQGHPQNFPASCRMGRGHHPVRALHAVPTSAAQLVCSPGVVSRPVGVKSSAHHAAAAANAPAMGSRRAAPTEHLSPRPRRRRGVAPGPRTSPGSPGWPSRPC